MLTIDVSREKKLEFSISVVGRFAGEPLAYWRLYCEKFNIGFPADISNYEKVVIHIPKLSDFIKPEIFGKIEKCHASLEIVNDRDMFLAWQDNVKLKFSEVKAALKDEREEEEKQVDVVATLKNSSSEEEPVEEKPKKKKKDDKIAENMLNALSNMTTHVSTEKMQEKNLEIQKNKMVNKVEDALKNIQI